MSQTEAWTIQRLLIWTTDYLGGHGVQSPRLDAEVLLSDALSLRRIDLYASYDKIPTESERGKFREMVRRRMQGTPVAYIVGRREFYSLGFRVTPDVLIPRPETEHLVVSLLDLVNETRQPGRPVEIADICTGSGVLAVCAAKYADPCRVVATDISPAAIEVARGNAKAHGVDGQIEFVECDLLAGIAADRRLDFVISNPPYVSEQQWQGLAREVRDHEPKLALVAGPKGSEVIQRLVTQAAERLSSGGWLLIEISPMVESDVYQILESDGRYESAATVNDLAGLCRLIQVCRI